MIQLSIGGYMKYYTTYQKSKSENSQEKKEKSWGVAIGLQDVDGLITSEYLDELKQENIDGKLSHEKIEKMLYSHYDQLTKEERIDRKMEADLVSNRIAELLEDDSFTFSPATLKSIHRYLFRGIYDFAGNFRTYNISKPELILNGESVKYANYFMIEDTFSYDFEEERKFDYLQCDEFDLVEHLSKFTSAIWQVHAFGEGNTRTTAVFIERYLNSIGFPLNNDMFKKYAQYFRNSLVRSNYADYSKGINSENKYLEHFFYNLLIEEKYVLRNRDTMVQSLFSEEF